MTHTADWRATQEAIPADSDDASEGADKMRDLKRDIRERIAIDHEMELAANSTTADGRHKKVTLVQQDSEPSNAASTGIHYSYNYAGVAEAHYMDPNGATVRLTEGGTLRPIVAGELASAAVTAGAFADNAVTAGALAAACVQAGEIVDNAVTYGAIAANAVTGSNIVDGVVVVAKLGDSAVAQAKLKTSTGSVSIALGTATYGQTAALPGGEYGFLLKVKGQDTDVDFRSLREDTLTTSYTCPGAYFYNNSGATRTGYAQQRYVTASGEVFWIFILRDKITKQIISMWQAPDHPCFGNGGKPKLVAHPFSDYDATKHEIIVINPSKKEVKAIQEATVIEDEEQPNKDFLEVVLEKYTIDEASSPQWPQEEVTVALPPDWDEAWLSQKLIQPIKKVIPRPKYVSSRRLKKKKIT